MTTHQFNQSYPSTERDVVLKYVVDYIFHESIQSGKLDNIAQNLPSYGNLKYLVNSEIEEIKQNVQETQFEGRLGPKKVNFNKNSNYNGNFSFSDQPLGLNSHSNFSTVKANVCVFKGKWQYEVMLGTKGVMQIGWATPNCVFTDETGVGDTSNSYSYDGMRQRSWNVTSSKYGDVWQCGDIISCCIDLDNGHISYLRNGKSLGVANKNVRTGPGYAYFPAFSLALGENFTVNFGESPFKFPQPGFTPLQAPDLVTLYSATKAFVWMLRIINLHSHVQTIKMTPTHTELTKHCLLITAQHVCSKLGPLLAEPFVIEQCVIPVIEDLTGIHKALQYGNTQTILKLINYDKTHLFLKYMIASLENSELLQFLENLILTLLLNYKQSSDDLCFNRQTISLVLFYVILSHQPTRQYTLNHIFFNKIRFLNFFNIKYVGEETLKEVVKNPFWKSRDNKFTSGDPIEYEASLEIIKKSVEGLVELQVAIIELLMTVEVDVKFRETSRAIFQTKLQNFIKQNLEASRPGAYVLICIFHRLMHLFNILRIKELPNDDIYIPLHLYCIDSFSFYNGSVQRLGGLESYLKKEFDKERNMVEMKFKDEKDLAQNLSDCSIESDDELSSEHKPSTSEDNPLQNASFSDNEPGTNIDSLSRSSYMRLSLYKLLDSIISIYHIGVHSRVVKMSDQLNTTYDNIDHTITLKKKMETEHFQKLPEYMKKKTHDSYSLLKEVVDNKSRHNAWLKAAIIPHSSQQHYYQLGWIILHTLKEASKKRKLFSFIPSFYVDALIELNYTITKYLPPSDTLNQEHQDILTAFGEFSSQHHCDDRIIYQETKDGLLNALRAMVMDKNCLTALESMPEQSRKTMVKNLLQPSKRKIWSQSDWILLRFWKGSGFAFRYKTSPHLLSLLAPKPHYTNDTPSYPLNEVGYPSTIFQGHVAEILNKDGAIKTGYLNTLLDHFNWAFSELSGLMKELQDASSRPHKVFIGSPQLQKCAAYFDQAVLLLRVLEMIITIAPHHFLDHSLLNAQLWLSRICQSLSQVLSRTTSKKKSIGHVINLEIPGLENIHEFPILTATAGVLVSLVKSDKNFKTKIITELLKEPSFKLEYLQSLFGSECDPSRISEPTSSRSRSSWSSLITCDFNLRNYPNDISESEITLLCDIIEKFHADSLIMSDSSKEDCEDECTICYAGRANALFLPCQHISCRTCISQYLLGEKTCFFCTTLINRVIMKDTNEEIYKNK